MIVTSPGTVSGLILFFDTGFFARLDPPPPPAAQPKNGVDGSGGGGGSGGKGRRDTAEGTSNAEEQGRPISSWFSTGPESRPTHWKQTLLWLRPSEKPEALDKGDAVAGRLALHRNEINPRELGLTLTWTATKQSTGRTYGGTQTYSVC